MQWGAKNLTKLIGKAEYIDGYRDMNASIVVNYEFCTNDPLTQLEFPAAKRLLSMMQGGYMSAEPTSLLNFTNANYLIANLNNFVQIGGKFNLDLVKSEAMSAYYNNSMKSLSIASNSPSLSYFRGTLPLLKPDSLATACRMPLPCCAYTPSTTSL